MAGNKENLTGKKKGGTLFPKYSLPEVRKSLKSLISKTHLNPISIQQLNSGVFSLGANSDHGKVRYSALKQFGLVDGTYAEITPSKLAKAINVAAPNELAPLLQQAFFHVKVFKNAFDTFHSAVSSRSRVLGYVTNELKVHPDSGDAFMDSFMESAVDAGLGRQAGENIELFSAGAPIPDDVAETGEETAEEDRGAPGGQGDVGLVEPDESLAVNEREQPIVSSGPQTSISSTSPNIDIKIDPSLDADKLEKQLAVLRKFGLI